MDSDIIRRRIDAVDRRRARLLADNKGKSVSQWEMEQKEQCACCRCYGCDRCGVHAEDFRILTFR